jgi:hypothetical protein
MNHKLPSSNAEDLKTKIKKLVSFEEGKGLSGPSQKPSKYARVLTCTFVRGAGEPIHGQRKQPRIVYFPDLTTRQEASIK